MEALSRLVSLGRIAFVWFAAASGILVVGGVGYNGVYLDTTTTARVNLA